MVAKEFYDPAAGPVYSAGVDALVGADPSAIVLVYLTSPLQIIPSLIGADLGPDTKQ